MKNRIFTFVGAAAVLLLAGCASQPVAIAPVGPEPVNHQAGTSRGFLKVFSDTETHEIGDNTYYYPHKGYEICTVSGKRLEYVPNHTGDMDESPALVAVPAGQYLIMAESTGYGRVRVPVVIRDGRVTVVYLNRDGKKLANMPANELVRLPDGEIVGWHS